MLIICDFDGTVTARDTNSFLAQRFAPEAYAGLEGKLAARELTLREVLATEFRNMGVPLPVLVATAVEGVPFRTGFGDFLDAAEASGHTVVLLSSGFRQVIEPMLARDGFADRVPLIANDIVIDGDDAQITWRDLPTCELCGEPCKRGDVTRLREGALHGATHFDDVVFVGDGLSDRCGAESADRVFARDSLATWLDQQDEPWEPWEDFHDVMRALQLEMAPGATR
ncbi:MAG: mtnX [Thermoleophilia bacterium]|jgi:2-hydroxy-3-keto-5-methylthiopentenyl-1-phosphate phosphatase|nr:mtnX [Thermoleophilia bacterium]